MPPGCKHQSAVGRRTFLKGVASIGVAVAAHPLRPSAAHAYVPLEQATPSGRPFKIGVVLPESQVYPTLGNSLFAGLKLAFAERSNLVGDRRVELLPASYGDRVSGAAKQARALIAEQHVDLLVGVMSSAATAQLRELLEAHQVPLILTNVGANVVRPRGENAYLFRASLNDWQANWATGAWVAKHVGKTAFIATSFYESGYDTSYMFARGLERAGGTILDRHVTHLPRQTDIFPPMLAAIKQAKPDLVYAAYSGQQARDFVRAYASAGLAGQIPLVGSGFLLDESLLASHGQAALHAVSGFAWALELDTPENHAFTSAYRAATGRPADPFAVLGYDAGQLIADAVETTAGSAPATRELLAALRTRQLHSPRGYLTMNHLTQNSAAPIYIREVRQHRNRFRNAVIARIDATAGLDEATATRASLKSGWLDAYLAV